LLKLHSLPDVHLDDRDGLAERGDPGHTRILF
jgi:hypothetical protein